MVVQIYIYVTSNKTCSLTGNNLKTRDTGTCFENEEWRETLMAIT